MALNCSGCDAVLMNVDYGKVCKERDELKAAYEAAQLGLKALNERMVFFSNQRDDLKKQVEQLEAEKAVLIRFVKDSCEACDLCSHAAIMADDRCEGICCECEVEAVCICGSCKGASNFEFAGVEAASDERL